MDEQILISQAKAGDRASLAEIVKRYESTVYNFAFKVCRDREKAENTMQETFLNMIRSLHQFDGNSKLSTWLYRIVVNNCLMEARSSKKYQFADISDDDEDAFEGKYAVDWESLPARVVENEELKKILDTAISGLAPEYRMVFLLRDVEELSTEETAKTLNLSVAAVKSRLHRARAFLRNKVGEALSK